MPAPGQPRVFYGWWIVASAWIIHAMSGALLFHAFGAYFVHLQSEFGWSRTVISGGFSLARLEGGFLGPIQGWLIHKLGPRTVVRIGVVAFAAGLILFSQMDSIPMFYAAFFIIAVGSGMCGFLTLNIVLANWFERRRSRAISLSATGSSSAGLLVPAIALALNTFGWSGTAFWSGVLVLLIGFPAAQLVRDSPEAYGLTPDGLPPATRSGGAGTEVPAAVGGFSAREALRAPSFWLLSAGHSAALLAISALSAHLIPYLVDGMRMSLETAAGFVALITATSFTAQLIGGFLGDRFDKRLLATAAMGGHTAAMLVLTFAVEPWQVVVFVILQGISWGVRGPLMTAVRAEYFGRRALASVEGWASLVTTIGLVAGPISAGFIADYTGGDYRPAFIFLAAVTAGGMVCFAMARRPAPPPIRAATLD